MNTMENFDGLADEAGVIKVRMTADKARLDAIRDIMISAGKTKLVDKVFKASTVTTPDTIKPVLNEERIAIHMGADPGESKKDPFRALAVAKGASPQLLTAHTSDKITRKGSVSLRVEARKDVAAASVAA